MDSKACETSRAGPCEAQVMAEQKKRCEKLLLQCFPPGSKDAATRRLHSHYSRKWCRELDCELRSHKEEEMGGMGGHSDVLLVASYSTLLVLFLIVFGSIFYSVFVLH